MSIPAEVSDNQLFGQHVYQDVTRLISLGVFGNDHSWDIGYEGDQPVYPRAPVATAGYILAMAGDEQVKLIAKTSYQDYKGIAEAAARFNEEMTVRLSGAVLLAVGALDIEEGEYVQATPDILDGSSATKPTVFDGDVITAFYHGSITVLLSSYTQDNPVTLPLGYEMLKIESADLAIFSNGTLAATVNSLTPAKDGFSTPNGAGATTGNEIALNNDEQGVYATDFQMGVDVSEGMVVINGWIKCKTGALSPWTIGQALRPRSARIDELNYDLVPVVLRGY